MQDMFLLNSLMTDVSKTKKITPMINREKILELTEISENNVILKELLDIKNKMYMLEYNCFK